MIAHEINDRAILDSLNRLNAGMVDMTPAMQEIGEFLIVTTKARFAAGKAPDGTPWAPKSQVTMDAYAARGDRVDTRPLFGPSGMLSQEIYANPDPTSVEWGSPLEYSAVMQFGAAQGAFGAAIGRTESSEKRKKSQDYFFPIPWGDIPARPYLGIAETDRDGINAIIAEYLDDLAQGR